MSIDERDIETMKRLAGEGKQITKIVYEDFLIMSIGEFMPLRLLMVIPSLLIPIYFNA